MCEAVGAQQTCGGQEGYIEAASHAATKTYDLLSTECMLQIDASNAFNNMNRELSLHNAQFTCPKIHSYLMSKNQKAAHLFIGKSMELESQEGTTKGDIATAYYAIDMKPLMDRLGKNIVQEWFADDAACVGELLPVKWSDQINDFGPKYGYFPKASKCWLICKSEEIATEAERIFDNTGINNTQTAHIWEPL